MGNLDCLPLEMIENILFPVDDNSLFTCRQVSKALKKRVEDFIPRKYRQCINGTFVDKHAAEQHFGVDPMPMDYRSVRNIPGI